MRSLVRFLAASLLAIPLSAGLASAHAELPTCDEVEGWMGEPNDFGWAPLIVRPACVYEGHFSHGALTYTDARGATRTSYAYGTVDMLFWVPEGATDCRVDLTFYDDTSAWTRRGPPPPVAIPADLSGILGVCEWAPANTPPTIDAGADIHRLPRADATISASYSDPDEGDAHTATIDWGDGAGARPVEAVDGRIVATASFPRGAYDVTLCVSDAAGETACDTLTLTIDGAHGKLTRDMLPGAGKAKGLA